MYFFRSPCLIEADAYTARGKPERYANEGVVAVIGGIHDLAVALDGKRLHKRICYLYAAEIKRTVSALCKDTHFYIRGN